MKRLLIIVGLAALGLLVFQNSKEVAHPSPETAPKTPALAVLPEVEKIPISPFFDQYGSDQQEPEKDLENVATAIEHLWLLLKNKDAISVMSNRSITAALLGDNQQSLRLLARTHPALNAKAELTDRWRTPLHFHPETLTKIEIRSAGPDRELFTEDDLTYTARGK